MNTQNVQIKQEDDNKSYGDILEIRKAEVGDKIIKEEGNSITIMEEETLSDYEMTFLFQDTKQNVSLTF